MCKILNLILFVYITIQIVFTSFDSSFRNQFRSDSIFHCLLGTRFRIFCRIALITQKSETKYVCLEISAVLIFICNLVTISDIIVNLS